MKKNIILVLLLLLSSSCSFSNNPGCEVSLRINGIPVIIFDKIYEAKLTDDRINIIVSEIDAADLKYFVENQPAPVIFDVYLNETVFITGIQIDKNDIDNWKDLSLPRNGKSKEFFEAEGINVSW